MTDPTTTTIAQTILAQLGGNRFAAMTGAKNFVDHGDALSMKLGKNAKGVTHLKVTLCDSDTYRLQFTRVWGRKVTSKADICWIYADQLRAIFEAETGLATNL